MSGVIDTNLLLYAVNADSGDHARAREFLNQARASAQTYFVTEGICYEFLRVSTHSRVFPRPLLAHDALTFLQVFLEAPNTQILSISDKHWDWLNHVLQGLHQPAGNLFFDLRTAALMREHGIHTIHTADTDFLQIAEIEVINPLKGNDLS